MKVQGFGVGSSCLELPLLLAEVLPRESFLHSGCSVSLVTLPTLGIALATL